VASAAAAHGVAVSVLGPRTVRMVTHLGVDDTGTSLAEQVLTDVLTRAA
jgi:threonine aldolase